MSHYTVKFSGSPAQIQKAAIAECKSWMGAKSFREFIENMRVMTAGDTHATRLRRLYCFCGFRGVSGRVVIHAVYRELVKA